MLVFVIYVVALMVLAFHPASYYLPPGSTWGVWHYTSLPAWLGWSAAVAAPILGFAVVMSPLPDRIARATEDGGRELLSRNKNILFILVSLASGALFWAFRIRHLRWGDAYVLSEAIPHPESPLVYNWQAPLTVLLHAKLWAFMNAYRGWSVQAVYAATSIVCGVFFVYVLFRLSELLGRDVVEKGLIFAMVASCGAMQLFFGYVENYTIISLGIILYVYLAVLSLRGEVDFLWPAVVLALTNAFHPSTLVLQPSLLYLAFRLYTCKDPHGKGRSPRDLVFKLVLVPIIVASGVLYLFERGGHGLEVLFFVDKPGGGDAIWFVPLFEVATEWQHYTMFSSAHFLDWLNEHVLISPLGLPLMVVLLAASLASRRPPAEDSRPEPVFLGVASAFYVFFTWVWNPDYGGRQDWDLFAPSAFVYTPLAAMMLARAVSDRRRLVSVGFFLALVGILHTATWVYFNTLP